MKLKLIDQGTDIVVLGTAEIVEAVVLARAASATSWASSHSGHFVRRSGNWKSRQGTPLPKDAKPGVRFSAVIRSPWAEPTVLDEARRHVPPLSEDR